MQRLSLAGGRAVAAFATAAAVLTGCGVQGTDAIEAGGPATVIVYPGPGQRVLLFFLSPEGRLAPVSRPGRKSRFSPTGIEQLDVQEVLSELFDGPLATERRAGLRTGLPRLKGPVGIGSAPGRLTIRIPIPVRHLEETAIGQVVCTAALAQGDEDTAVTIEGEDGTLPPAHCQSVL
ncbi:hypothetical protein AB0919_43990 [Streptomyces sp. NPDC046994]|uniref:hypothetical protein n=1 Tax=Streptomyces sp. NPDC046994 TaxID=3155735 RepID=UPI003455679A